MWFIAALCTAVGAAYVYEKSEKTFQTVAIACIPVVIGAGLLALIMAPWPLQLMLLIGILASDPLAKTDLLK
jgi:hypothetical protein